jgi:CBS domain containing-hemolysin-like protein
VGLVLLAANGAFVAVEFSLLASRRTRIEARAEEGDGRARAALASMRELNVQLAGAQLGVTMASLLLGFVLEPAVSHLLDDALGGIGALPDGVVHTLGFLVGLTIVAFLHMVIGEMVPKNIALADPERTLLALSRTNRAYVVVTGPVLRALTAIVNAGVRLLGVEPRDELATSASAQELADMLGQSREEGLIEEVAHQLLTGALRLGQRTVGAVMVPRRDVVWLRRTATPAEAEALVVSSGLTRIVVGDEGIDRAEDLVGFLHAKDLLTVPGPARHRPLPVGRLRPMLVLGETMPLDEALLQMQRERLHVAAVTDRVGRTLGIATLEDVIEALVGDIRDESDR